MTYHSPRNPVVWFSCGVSSAVAAFLRQDADLVRIRIDDEHEDNDRFAEQVSAFLGKRIEVLQSKYRSVAAAIRSTRYVNGPSGASCTRILKRRVRQEWESKNYCREYIWGFDLNEKRRLARLVEKEPGIAHSAPLIESGLSKSEAHGLFMRVFGGIARPAMYGLGFPNNNCIGCVKGGMGYWNRIRKEFPDVFASRAALEREVGRSCINGVFLDELRYGDGSENVIYPECGLSCLLAEAEA